MGEKNYHGVPGSTPMSSAEFRALMSRPRPSPKSPELQALDRAMAHGFKTGKWGEADRLMAIIPEYEPTKH